ncbi:MAG: hypothetical protein L3J79_08435 [Candidatus Marinimicrobia bacterium]|nr:hypothetical protein [Candidatus Neomarinimicrobiota bacterium]
MSLVSVANADVVQPALYGVRSFSNELMSLDLDTGTATSIATLDYGGVVGMAYDGASDTLYGASYTSGLLFTIDPTAGRTIAIGRIGNGISGMTYDNTSGYLFGVDGVADTLIRIDPSTGQTTTVGSMGYAGIFGIAIDTATNRMYAVDNFVDKFLIIDMSTGQASTIAELDMKVGGITFDPTTGMLLAVNTNASGDLLYSIDPMSGQTTLIGDVGYSYIQGLAFAIPAPGIPAFVFVLSMGVLRRKRSRNGMCL